MCVRVGVGVGVRVRGREREGKRDRWKESDREIGREEDVAIILLNYFELSFYTCCFYLYYYYSYNSDPSSFLILFLFLGEFSVYVAYVLYALPYVPSFSSVAFP